MPAFISSIASCSAVASRTSTIRSTRPPLRTMRPKFDDKGIFTVTSAITAAAPRSASSEPAIPASSSPVTSGISPQTTTSRPDLGASRSSATVTACPVPNCSSWTTLSTSKPSISSRSSELMTTTISPIPAWRSACTTYHSIGRPQISCSTLVHALFMRVPLPAAKTMARITPPPPRFAKGTPTLAARACWGRRANRARFAAARERDLARAAPSNRRAESK